MTPPEEKERVWGVSTLPRVCSARLDTQSKGLGHKGVILFFHFYPCGWRTQGLPQEKTWSHCLEIFSLLQPGYAVVATESLGWCLDIETKSLSSQSLFFYSEQGWQGSCGNAESWAQTGNLRARQNVPVGSLNKYLRSVFYMQGFLPALFFLVLGNSGIFHLVQPGLLVCSNGAWG